jgi:phage tail sheath protein FI
MAFQLSPGVNFSEIDLTNATAAVATTEGALAGVFRWGPINERKLITSETQLVDVYGAPNTRFTNSPTNSTTWTNHETFYTAANFLGYTNALYVNRVVELGNADASKNAKVSGDNGGSNDVVTAKYYGALGNSVEVSYCTGDGDGDSDGLGLHQFNGVNGTGTVTVNPSNGGDANKSLTFEGLGTAAELNKLTKGTKITIRTASDENSDVIQEVYLAGDATAVSATGSADTETVITGAAPTSDSGSLNSSGLIIHDETGGNPAAIAASILASSIISLAAQVDADGGDIHDIDLGDPVTFDAGTSGVPGGLVDGKTYFAIPVSDADATVGETVDDDTDTRAFKLAATYEDATNHTDAAPKHVEITSLAAGGASTTGTFDFFDEFDATAPIAGRYTGLVNGTAYYTKTWGDADLFDSAPTSASNLHIVVKDIDGEITGTAGSVIETFENVSETPGAKKEDGTSNFITDVLVASSKWISVAETKADDLSAASSSRPLTGGSDGEDEKDISLGRLALGYDLFADATQVDVSFILQGKPRGNNGYELANYIIDNVAETRRDCVAFVSPVQTATTAQTIVDFAGSVSASTYAVVDSGYKYQYDKYSDAYRYVPLNGDIAGLCARTDDLRDPWFSPAGYNRGSVKNVVKLNFNPNKAQRDLLYKNGVNPVITQPGQGTVLFGDKTFSGVTSAFDRINVRRLFIVLEKTIANAAKSTLFEFNDEFTRATFRNLVEPFLRDVQGRRGIYDFKVVCDESNNTGQVIDTNSFVGDIYIKPARSINFIQLNFVAVRTGVEFSEVVGAA